LIIILADLIYFINHSKFILTGFNPQKKILFQIYVISITFTPLSVSSSPQVATFLSQRHHLTAQEFWEA